MLPVPVCQPTLTVHDPVLWTQSVLPWEASEWNSLALNSLTPDSPWLDQNANIKK